jgi:hypothetical protein
MSVADEGYSNLLTMSVADEGYSNLLTECSWWSSSATLIIQRLE